MKTKINLNYMKIFRLHLTENIVGFYLTEQAVDAVWANNGSFSTNQMEYMYKEYGGNEDF